ncbi:MAG: hypothetical protein JWP61_98, partial [Friedmanniella sp.]|nr:hypothetical protein [Friedmanniella sp.]
MWSNRVASLPLPELALALLEVAGPSAPPEDLSLRRALYLLYADRFADALGALEPQPFDPAAEMTVENLIRATALAATPGPFAEPALSWLLDASSALVHDPAAALLADSLARVGRARGDHELADEAYAQLARLGVRDREVGPHLAALILLNRSQTELPEAQRHLTDALDLLAQVSESVATDPGPVLETAAELRRRGDLGGAAVLLRWVNRLNPKVAAIRQAQIGLPPSRPGPARIGSLTGVWTVVALVATWGLLTSHSWFTGLAVIGLGLWYRYVKMPGLSLVDSRLWRGASWLSLKPVTRRDLIAIGATTMVSIPVGVTAALTVLESLGRSGPPPLGQQVLVWALSLGVLPTVVGLLARRRRRREALRDEQVRLRAERHAMVTSSGRCRCWTCDTVSGSAVAVYLDCHLSPVGLPAALEPVAADFPGARLRTATCEQTGAAWLAVQLSEEGAVCLFRSALADRPAPGPVNPAASGTGFYLEPVRPAEPGSGHDRPGPE